MSLGVTREPKCLCLEERLCTVLQSSLALGDIIPRLALVGRPPATQRFLQLNFAPRNKNGLLVCTEEHLTGHVSEREKWL